MAFDLVASGELSSTSDAVLVPLPRDGQQYHMIARLSGTFSATVQLQSSTDNGSSFSAQTTTVVADTTQGNPTAVGVYAIDCGSGAEYGRVKISAYTSGTVRAEVWLVPTSS